MAKGVCKCLLLRSVCDILNAVLHFAQDVRHFAFEANLGFVCQVLKKRGKVLKIIGLKTIKKSFFFNCTHSHCERFVELQNG